MWTIPRGSKSSSGSGRLFSPEESSRRKSMEIFETVLQCVRITKTLCDMWRSACRSDILQRENSSFLLSITLYIKVSSITMTRIPIPSLCTYSSGLCHGRPQHLIWNVGGGGCKNDTNLVLRHHFYSPSSFQHPCLTTSILIKIERKGEKIKIVF